MIPTFARRLPLGALVAIALASSSPGCSSTEASTFLDPTDLEPYAPGENGPPATYDRNNVLDDASLVDVGQATPALVQKYLERNPYGKRSFLGTYQSNGLRASDALVTAARNYRINPIVLLVLAQVRAGLVSLTVYPEDPARVEYAFQCGCEAKGQCDPRSAGFDKQVDCVALRLREALEAVKVSGAAPSGFGPNRTAFTVDGARVTPANAATAALYHVLPREAKDEPGGIWLVWNLWQKYTLAYEYAGPFEPTPEGGGIGEACQNARQCALPASEAICATEYPGGMCTTQCTSDCPVVAGKGEGYCADFRSTGICLAVCNPNAPTCRKGYTCTRVARFGAPKESQYTCYPEL